MSGHCQHCDEGCRGTATLRLLHYRLSLGVQVASWVEGHCPACERDTWWDEAFQRQARTAEQYRAEGRAQEAERLAKAIKAEACTVEEAVDITRGVA